MRTLPKPWTPPHPREIYAQYIGPTSWQFKERKYSKSPDDTLIPIATLSARGPVTAERAHKEAMRLARRLCQARHSGQRGGLRCPVGRHAAYSPVRPGNALPGG